MTTPKDVNKMQKIMFDTRYGLEQAVLEGRKTMTRRIIPQLKSIQDPELSDWGIDDKGRAHITLYEGERPTTDIYPKYQPGEIVAIAQSYSRIAFDLKEVTRRLFRIKYSNAMGWNNKMYVKASEMVHYIKITNIKVERLQNISEEDCMREGVQTFDSPSRKVYVAGGVYVGEDSRLKIAKGMINLAKPFSTARAAFAVLIDKVCGKGTWNSNPWVLVYEFELIRKEE